MLGNCRITVTAVISWLKVRDTLVMGRLLVILGLRFWAEIVCFFWWFWRGWMVFYVLVSLLTLVTIRLAPRRLESEYFLIVGARSARWRFPFVVEHRYDIRRSVWSYSGTVFLGLHRQIHFTTVKGCNRHHERSWGQHPFGQSLGGFIRVEDLRCMGVWSFSFEVFTMLIQHKLLDDGVYDRSDAVLRVRKCLTENVIQHVFDHCHRLIHD